MRTTVNIDDRLLEQAKERAREQGVSLGAILEESLQSLFTQAESVEPHTELLVFSGGGFLPGIDPTSNASLYDAMDDDEELRRQAGLV